MLFESELYIFSMPDVNSLGNLTLYRIYIDQFTPLRAGGKGGLCRMIASLIDFSFIRSLVADCYTTIAPPCYDPPSLFLLDLFRYIDGYKDMCRFCEVLRA